MQLEVKENIFPVVLTIHKVVGNLQAFYHPSKTKSTVIKTSSSIQLFGLCHRMMFITVKRRLVSYSLFKKNVVLSLLGRAIRRDVLLLLVALSSLFFNNKCLVSL